MSGCLELASAYGSAWYNPSRFVQWAVFPCNWWRLVPTWVENRSLFRSFIQIVMRARRCIWGCGLPWVELPSAIWSRIYVVADFSSLARISRGQIRYSSVEWRVWSMGWLPVAWAWLGQLLRHVNSLLLSFAFGLKDAAKNVRTWVIGRVWK